MLFFTYFDPSLIGYAESQGQAERQLLTRMLRDFCANCCLAEIDEWKVATSIKNEVSQLQDQNFRDRVKRFLTVLKKRNRFVNCIQDEYNPGKSDVQLAVEQAGKAGLDLIATETDCDAWSRTERTEICDLLGYTDTRFFDRREDSTTHGHTVASGEISGDALLTLLFGPIVRHCRSIEITDRVWGPKFGDSFQFTTRRLLEFIAKNNKHPGSCRVVIHTEVTPRLTNIKDQLRRLQSPCVIEICCYSDRVLPHDRFLWTNQIGLMIGRGLDFLSYRDGGALDTTLNLKKVEDIEKLMPKLEPQERIIVSNNR